MSDMNPQAELLTRYASYNVWANKRIADMLQQAAAKDFDTTTASSFDSLRKTLYHIWDAQVIWLLRLQGESIREWPSKNFVGNFEQAVSGFIKQSEKFLSFVTDADDAFLEGRIAYANTHGEKFERNVADILMHVCNHSTYHRGQLVTMLRQLGYATGITSTDLNSYVGE